MKPADNNANEAPGTIDARVPEPGYAHSRTRRQLLCRSSAIASLGILDLLSSSAMATTAANILSAYADGRRIVSDKLVLSLPPVAENGNSVPLVAEVDSPMSEQDYVESLLLLAEKNPNVIVAEFHFTPESGLARVATRIRLASTQDVVALARMNDGRVFADRQHVQVTIGGCGSEPTAAVDGER